MRLAAQNGHAKAQYHYALMLQYGKGVVDGGEPRVAEAAKWYRRSAEKGFVPSMYNLSVLLRKKEGIGIVDGNGNDGVKKQRDETEANRWFTRAIKSSGSTYAKLRAYSAHKAKKFGSKKAHLHV